MPKGRTLTSFHSVNSCVHVLGRILLVDSESVYRKPQNMGATTPLLHFCPTFATFQRIVQRGDTLEDQKDR